jgi:GDP-D-mannose dehydratase
MGGEVAFIPPRPAESKLSLANASKALNEIGWSAKVRLEDWIAAHK